MKKLTLLIMLLGMITISNAQIEKIELNLTPEMEEMVVTKIESTLKKRSDEALSNYGIKNRSQLENLHIGKPIPMHMIVNEKLEFVHAFNVSQMSEGEPLSLSFRNIWHVPVMSDETPFLFGVIDFSDVGKDPFIGDIYRGAKNTIEHFHNYEHKDSIIGCVLITPSGQLNYLIIRKENQDIFVQIYDEVTGEYFKNEYNFSELINHMKALDLRAREARMRYFEYVANKSELEMTPEITEMLINKVYSGHINKSDESLFDWGIKDRAQLERLHLGKPIPVYAINIENDSLRFTGCWNVLVMSDGEPLHFTAIQLKDDGQYRWRGSSSATKLEETIHNYEYKDLIIGCLGIKNILGMDYLIIRKDNKDIFVQRYDDATGEYLKNEYSLSEVINLIKIRFR